MENSTNRTIIRCGIMIFIMLIFNGKICEADAVGATSNFDQILEDNIEKILSEKFGLTSSQIKKSNINNNQNVTNPNKTTSLMEMVKNIMTDSGTINNASTAKAGNNESTNDPNLIESHILSMLHDNQTKKIENDENEDLQNALSEFIKSSLANKIDDAKKQILESILDTLDESLKKNKTDDEKNDRSCVDIYKECNDLKKSGVCKTSKELMMKNCKRTCGFCHKKTTVIKKKAKKIKKPLKKQKVVKKHKKRITEKQKLQKKYKCPLHCRSNCAGDCPKHCCVGEKRNESPRKPEPARIRDCGPSCPRFCAPSCSPECCSPVPPLPQDNPPNPNYGDKIELNTVQSGVCLNDLNCPSFCFPECNIRCCEPDNDAVNLLKESFINNLNNANVDQRNEIMNNPPPIPQIPLSPPAPLEVPIESQIPSDLPQTCPAGCFDNNCNSKLCPNFCCNENEIKLLTTVSPIEPKPDEDGHYLNNSNEQVLSNCPKDCMYNCTDACFRNKCCDKK